MIKLKKIKPKDNYCDKISSSKSYLCVHGQNVVFGHFEHNWQNDGWRFIWDQIGSKNSTPLCSLKEVYEVISK